MKASVNLNTSKALELGKTPNSDNARQGVVEIRQTSCGYGLFRDGEPFWVKGACGFANLDRLAACGANSVRTWGSDQTLPILEDIRRVGLTLCAGLWMESPRRGFDYGNRLAVRAQEERLLAEVEQIAGEPGLLLWGVGNELDLACDEPRVWDAVESLAQAIKARDSAHPVITVVASPTERTLRRVAERCPSLDALGVNSYSEIHNVIPALDAVGWSRPYFVTEWGPNGSWEVGKAPWGAPLEPTSLNKASQMAERYRMIASDARRCLGSYAFFWGNKQETTPTWFNLFDPDGAEYEGVAALRALWGSGPNGLTEGPHVHRVLLDGATPYAHVAAGVLAEATAECSGLDGDGVSLQWALRPEARESNVGGDPEEALQEIEVEFEAAGKDRVRFEAPAKSGAYRIYAYLTDSHGRRSTANLPFWVTNR